MQVSLKTICTKRVYNLLSASVPMLFSLPVNSNSQIQNCSFSTCHSISLSIIFLFFSLSRSLRVSMSPSSRSKTPAKYCKTQLALEQSFSCDFKKLPYLIDDKKLSMEFLCLSMLGCSFILLCLSNKNTHLFKVWDRLIF